MKKELFLIVLATVAVARENPFVLPHPEAGSVLPHKPSAGIVKKEPVRPAPVAQEAQKAPQAAKSAKPMARQPVADLKFLRIYQDGNEVRLETKDRLRRAFVIKRESKAVFDFRASRAFATKRIPLKPPFAQATVGTHRGFYRVVIRGSGCAPKIDKATLRVYCPDATAP